MISTEFQLLVESSRQCFTDKPARVSLRPCVASLDWNQLVHLARRHRVQGLLYGGLSEVGASPPDDVNRQIRADASSIAEQNLRQAAESAELLDDFSSAGIPLLFLKGLPVGALAYRQPLLKMGWDIDILVAPNSLPEAAKILTRRGYQIRIPKVAPESSSFSAWHRRRKESVWYRPNGGFHVELHTRVADNPALIPMIDVHSPAQRVQVLPSITLPTFALDELFAYLSVHGASSAWFRLKWIADLGGLLAPLKAKMIERVYERSQELGAARAAAQALLLVTTLYDVPLSEELRKELRRDPSVRRLFTAAMGELSHSREPLERPLGTRAIRLTQLLLIPGWRFKADEAARQVRDMLW